MRGVAVRVGAQRDRAARDAAGHPRADRHVPAHGGVLGVWGTGARAKACCLLIHADASLSLSLGYWGWGAAAAPSPREFTLQLDPG